MYSRIAFISEYFTSFSTTTGCLQGSSVKRDWKYDEHAANTILWHLTEVPPSQARVTSVNASLRRSSSNTASKLVLWLFHLRQYCCVALPILLLVKGAVPKRPISFRSDPLLLHQQSAAIQQHSVEVVVSRNKPVQS